MSKKLTIIIFALLGLLVDVLCCRQTVLMSQKLDLESFPVLFSYFLIAISLLACILLFARKDRFKKS